VNQIKCNKTRTKYLILTIFLGITIWWLSLMPSNNRDWQTDVAILSYAKIDGDKITIYNI